MRRLLIAALLCLVLSTCTTSNRVPGFVHYRIGNNPTTLDPALIVDVNGGTIAAKLFNGLVKLGPGLDIEPELAESWTVSRDGLTYRFDIREDVTFSSGRQVRAWDFKYSFERVLDPETRSPQTWIFDGIKGAREFMEGGADTVEGIRVIDDHRLEIRLESPFSPFLGLLTMPAAYVVPLEEVLQWGEDFSSHPVGTGPFILREWLPNRHLRLEGRDSYFAGQPRVPGIIYRIIPEELTSVAEFELGNLDAIAIPASEYSRYSKSAQWRDLIVANEGLNTYYLGLNCQRPPFDDPEVRRAMGMAIDRRKILDTLYEGRGNLASGPVPGILRRWPPPEATPYDPDEARRVLHEHGADEVELGLYITSDQEVVDMAEVIQAYLREAGLTVRILSLEWSAFKEATNKGEAHMFWLSWWADYPDPENFLFPTFHSSNHGSGGNRVRYSNEKVDALIEKGQGEPVRSKTDEYYSQAEAIIAEEAPWVFFWHKKDVSVRQPWLKHFRLYPVYSMDKGLEVELAGGRRG